MDVGISVHGHPNDEVFAELFREYNINKTFIMSERDDFEETIAIYKKQRIECETLHAPFRGVNDMWSDDLQKADRMLSRLKDCIDKCKRHSIKTAIVHLSSGRPMPMITKDGVERFEKLFCYAEENGVTVALENQRYMENLSFFLDRYPLGFCWDTGHENCFMGGVRVMEKYSSRLCALHIHDNMCIKDRDEHLLPFDGEIDFEYVAKAIRDSKKDCTLMLEVSRQNSRYLNMSDREYTERAAKAVCRLKNMIENK